MASENEEYSRLSPPSWELLALVAPYMDAKTLAVASCVSKTWSLCFSSTHLWRLLCNTHHPSLSTAAREEPRRFPAVSYKRLYSMAESAAKRRFKQPPKPKISLSDLIFTVHMSSASTDTIIVKQGKDFPIQSEGLFRFDIHMNHEGSVMAVADQENVKVTWNVVFRDWEAIFTMMDGVKSAEAEGWFSVDLPAPECCPSGSGLATDVKLTFNSDGGGGDGRVRIEKVSLGIMDVIRWRYLQVDDGLRYLEYFLL